MSGQWCHGGRATVPSLLIGLLCLLALAGLSAATFRPGPLAAVSSGDLILLEPERGILRLKPSEPSESIITLTNIPAFDQAVDVAVARIDDTESIFVTMTPKVLGRSPRLVRFSLSGKQVSFWELPPWKGTFSGIAIDAERHRAYLANGETSEIYTVDLKRPMSAPVRLTGIRSGTALGAMVLDAKRRRLLVADSEQGVIYGLDLESGKVSEVVRGTGEPLALALDPIADRLYIADGLNERIHAASLNISRWSTKAYVFAAFKEFEEPLGLALGAEGALWVADRQKGLVYLISREGKLLKTIRPKNF